DVARLAGRRRDEVALVLVRLQRLAFEKGHVFVEDRLVSRDLEVTGHGEREPESVVADARADAASGRRVPPVLALAREKRASRPAQDLSAEQAPPRHGEGHRVLELIAEPVRAARLVEGGAPPEPTRERLVEQPAVDEQVERRVGRLHLEAAENAV